MRFLLCTLLLVATDGTEQTTSVGNMQQLSNDWNEQAGARQELSAANSSTSAASSRLPDATPKSYVLLNGSSAKRKFTSPHLTEEGHPHASIGAYVSTALKHYQLVQTEVEHAQRLMTSTNIDLGDPLKELADAVKFGIQVMKMILENIEKGWDAAQCVIEKAPDSILNNFGDLLGDPAKFFEEWSKKLEAFIPKLITKTQGTVDTSLSLLDGIFSGEAVDIKPLQLKMLKDIEYMATIDPVTKCLVPLIETAYKGLENPNIKMSFGGKGTLEQKLMSWVMEGPWMETIVPAIPKLFDKALTEAVNSISDGISGMTGDSLDEVKRFITGIMRKKQAAGNDKLTTFLQSMLGRSFDQGGIEGALAELDQLQKEAMLLKFSFADAAKDGMEALVQALSKPLLEWIMDQLPQWYDYAVDTAAGGVFKTATFVEEEILAEPAPFTQWGMEGIGSGVGEPLKAAFTLVKQVGRELLMKAIHWLLPPVIKEITRLTGLGAAEFGKLLDQLLGPVIQVWNKMTDMWLGATKSMFRTFNSDFMNQIMKALKDAFYKLVDAVVPGLSEGLRLTQSIVKITSSRLCQLPDGHKVEACATVLHAIEMASSNHSRYNEVLTEMHTQRTALVAIELKGQWAEFHGNAAQAWTDDPVRHPSFEEYLLQSSPIPTWIDHVLDPRANDTTVPALEPDDKWLETTDEEKAEYLELTQPNGMKPSLLELLHEKKKQGRGRKSGPSVHQLRDLHDTMFNKLPESMVHVQKLLTKHQLHAKESQAAELKQIAVHFNKAQQFVDAGNQALKEDEEDGDGGWLGKVMEFMQKRKEDFVCYQKSFDSTSASIMDVMGAKDMDDAMKILGADIERIMKAMFKGLQKNFEMAIDMFDPKDKKLLETNTNDLFDPNSLINLFEKGLKNFNDVDPALSCSISVVSDGLELIKPELIVFIKEMKKLFNSIMTTMGTGAMSLGIFAAVPMLENLIFGKEKMKEIQANVQSAAQEFQSGTAPGLGGQLESLAGMKEGGDRSALGKQIGQALSGNMTAAQMAAIAFKGIQTALVDELVNLVESALPALFDGVGDVGGAVALPGATVGANVGVGSGTVGTEWLSTGGMNIAQQIWQYAQTTLRGMLVKAVGGMVGAILNAAFDGVYKFIVKPLATEVDGIFGPMMQSLIKAIPDSVKEALIDLVNKLLPGINTAAAMPAVQQQSAMQKTISMSLAWVDPDPKVTCSPNAFTCGSARISMSAWQIVMLPLLLVLMMSPL